MVREISSDDVTMIRNFNRTVTERIGALEESFLGRDRPLGASRLLWEVGEDGADLHELRYRLGLDSGYASRLLRRLEDDGLVVVEAHTADRRRRKVRLTAAGRAEVRELDRLSDVAAAAMLDGVPARRRGRLLAAVSEVERALRATMVDVAVEDAKFEGGFDAGKSISARPEELTPPAGYCVVARLRGRPIGCGALKLHGAAPAELKRMWVEPDSRGLGVGERLLESLQALAHQNGASVLRLETNRALDEAIGLYRAAGFAEVAPFNQDPYAHHWFEKELT
jgi:DNA-binding MarR family transcriptional regulator